MNDGHPFVTIRASRNICRPLCPLWTLRGDLSHCQIHKGHPQPHVEPNACEQTLPLTVCLRVGPFDCCVRVHWLSLLQEHKTANGRRDLQNAIILITNPENQGEFFSLQSCQSASHQASLILVPLCLYEFSRNATWIWMKGDNLSVIDWAQLRWGETASHS